MILKYLRPHLLIFAISLVFASENSVDAQIIYSSSSFTNLNVVTDDATEYTVTTDILQGGAVAGVLTGTFIFGGGTNPFETPNVVAGNNLIFTARSTNTSETQETADGIYNFSIAPATGFQVDGISVFTIGTVIANPTFANLTSNGSATVIDANEGTATELFASHNSGAFTNGSNLVFNAGPGNGIVSDNHSRNWSYDSAGATTLSFEYQAGPVPNISSEGIRLDAQLSLATVPEPSAIALLGLMGSLAFLRRRSFLYQFMTQRQAWILCANQLDQ